MAAPRKAPAKTAAKKATAGPRAAAPPAPLGPRGRALWAALHKDVTRDAATDALILEACRIADRLDRLDALLRGDREEWLHLRQLEDGSIDGTNVVMTVNPLLAEARQQATALQRLLDKLQTKAEPTKKGPTLAELLAAGGTPAPPGQ